MDFKDRFKNIDDPRWVLKELGIDVRNPKLYLKQLEEEDNEAAMAALEVEWEKRKLALAQEKIDKNQKKQAKKTRQENAETFIKSLDLNNLKAADQKKLLKIFSLDFLGRLD